MSDIVFVDDFPTGYGGSEFVNKTFCDLFKISKIQTSKESEVFNPNILYVVGNVSTMSPKGLKNLSKHPNYIILEHDYKCIQSRHPWRFDDCIIPNELKVNLNLYINAKVIFTQTEDHTEVFRKNNIKGNFISLSSSLWSEEELQLLEELRESSLCKSSKFCVIDSPNWIKNTKGAKEFCEANKLDFDIVKGVNHPQEFLKELSKYSCLVFFPIARESFCRLIVEAKCIGMNVITSPNSGAWQASWYSDKSGSDLISYLREKTQENIRTIKKYL
tara:strand:+ start:1001 stop:1822 length:822 start_codon:yes stop_codon:yes gene_type:complete